MTPLDLAYFAAIAALLLVSVYAVRRRPAPVEAPAPVIRAMTPPTAPAPPTRRPYTPPAGSIMVAQMEVGQTVHLQTEAARYALTLRDAADGLYDATRTVQRSDGRTVRKVFRMLFFGSFVPHQRLMSGWFVIGGRLSYYECDDAGGCTGPTTSTSIQRVIFTIPLKQAS